MSKEPRPRPLLQAIMIQKKMTIASLEATSIQMMLARKAKMKSKRNSQTRKSQLLKNKKTPTKMI